MKVTTRDPQVCKPTHAELDTYTGETHPTTAVAKESLLAWATEVDERKRCSKQSFEYTAVHCGAAVLAGIAIVNTLGKAKDRTALSVASSLAGLVGVDMVMRFAGQIAPRVVACLLGDRSNGRGAIRRSGPSASESPDFSGGPI